MIAEVPRVLESHVGRYGIVTADFLDPNADFGSGKYDAVVSGFAIHHAVGEEAYRDVYGHILRALAPGGVFVNLDHVAGATRQHTLENATAWRAFLHRSEHIPTDRFLLGTFAKDYPIPLEAHVRLMEATGFIDIDVIWKKAIFALYCG